ncbi:6408_t:CDS:1, partial [Dentiscutata heterogama]
HQAKISSWINHVEAPYNIYKNPYDYKLIFKASINGFKVDDFYEKCNNKCKTVVVLKTHSTNEILGGYNPLIWKKTKNRKYKKTEDSFIFKFSDTMSTISRVVNADKAIYYDDCSGPSFGKRDLSLQCNMVVNDKWYCKKKCYSEQLRSVYGFFNASDYE